LNGGSKTCFGTGMFSSVVPFQAAASKTPKRIDGL